MSRTNPYKKKQRSAKQTLLMYGEGLGEEVFLKHLRGLYARDSGVSVAIKKGKGGDASSVVIDASNAPGGYDRRVVVLDNDKGQEEMSRAREEAKKRGIEMIEHTPCLEAILLAILNERESYSGKSSAWCKGEFESKYLDKKKRTEIEEYKKVFPKEMLDTRREKVDELDKMIALMEKEDA